MKKVLDNKNEYISLINENGAYSVVFDSKTTLFTSESYDEAKRVFDKV